MNDQAATQVFTHVKNKQTFDVPIVVPSESAVQNIESIIGELLF